MSTSTALSAIDSALPVSTPERMACLFHGILANDILPAQLLAKEGVLGADCLPDGLDMSPTPRRLWIGSLPECVSGFTWEYRWPESLVRAVAVIFAFRSVRLRLARQLTDLFFPPRAPPDAESAELLCHELSVTLEGFRFLEKFPHRLPCIKLENIVFRGVHPGVLRTLVARGDHLRFEDELGRTPLFEPIMFGASCLRTVRTLLELGADPNHREHRGRTPLHFAAYARRTSLVKALLAFGADIQAIDADGASPLITAFVSHRDASDDLVGYKMGTARLIPVVKMLLAAGATPTDSDRTGDTGLHIVARRGTAPLVRSLLRLGFDSEALNHEGHTPAQVAYLANNGDAYRALTRRRLCSLPTMKRGVAVPAPEPPVMRRPVLGVARFRSGDWTRLFARLDALSSSNLDALSTNPHLPERLRLPLAFAGA